MDFSNIEKLKKNSSSYSIQYFAKYQGKEDVVVKAHLKLKDEQKFRKDLLELVGNKRLGNYIINAYNIKYKSWLGGMEYENKIYSEIIHQIVKQKISPNFVEFVTLKSEPFKKFMQTFHGYRFETSKDWVNALKYFMTRATSGDKDLNFLDIFLLNKFDILSKTLTMVKDLEQLARIYADNIDVVFVVTKRVLGVQNKIFDFVTTSRTTTEEELKEILFQLFFNLYLMQKIKLQHNDLHDGNILIETLPKRKKILYVVDGTKYTVTTKYLLRIYDWDLAYVDDSFYGVNSRIDDVKHVKAGIRNEIVKNFDFYHILCAVYRHCYNPMSSSTLCKATGLFKKLFANLIEKGIFTVSEENNTIHGFDLNGQFYLRNRYSNVCRANNVETLLQMPELKSILENEIFKPFRSTKRGGNYKIAKIRSSLNINEIMKK